MVIALIKNEIVENTIVIESVELATEIFKDHLAIQIDSIDPMPEIGDNYTEGSFIKADPIEE